MANLPPPNRVPRNFSGEYVLAIDSYTVGSWTSRPDGQGPVTQVHIHLEVRGEQSSALMVWRLKSARACDELIAALQRHRNDVWPQTGTQNRGESNV